MFNRKISGSMKIIMPAAIIACIAVMILSAAAASTLYTPSRDSFTASLGQNIALLCKNTWEDLSDTQLKMIENAQINGIRYDTDSEGNRLFNAKLRLHAPVENAGKYSDNPDEYLQQTLEKMNNGGAYEDIEIFGICKDNSPLIDVDALGKIAQAAEQLWQKEELTSSKNFEYALTDIIIPEPFPDRVMSEGASYQTSYIKWLDKCSTQFASQGVTVTKDGQLSSEAGDIRAAMEQAITPYLCSVRNITLERNPDKKGFFRLSFDSLDIIGTLSAAKKPSISALNKLAGVYSNERALRVSIDIDLARLLSDGEIYQLPFFNIVSSVTRYCSFIGTTPVKIKIPDEPKVIAGKSNGQWPLELKRAKGDGNVIVDVIQIGENGTETSVVKVFLTDGGKITVCLSKGQYRLNMAVGTTYYGGVEIFGINGIYMKDTQNTYTIPSKDLKSITVAKQPAESLSFTDYLLGQGVDPSLIDKSQF